MIFDSIIDTSDDSGYLIAVGICCLTFFILEYLIPKIKKWIYFISIVLIAEVRRTSTRSPTKNIIISIL